MEAWGTKSIIDNIIINEKLKATIGYARVFRGSDTNTDHHRLQSTFQISKRYYTHRKTNKTTERNKTLNIHLLEEESIQTLHGNRLTEKLKQKKTYNVEENWLNIKHAILEAAKGSLGYKPIKKKTRIRTLNEELEQIIDRKKHEYKIYIHKLKTHNNTLNIRNLE
jgi:hypothetical protein